MYRFHQKDLFCTQTFDGEKIKRGKGRTSCFCISWSINPKHLYFSSQSALSILHQTSWGEASSGTHLTPQLKASTGWWAEVSRTVQHILHPSGCLPAAKPRFHLCCHPTPQPTMPVSPFSCRAMHKGWDKEKRADCHNTTMIPGKGGEESLPWRPVGRSEGGSTWSKMGSYTPVAGRGSSLSSLWAEKRHQQVMPQQMPPSPPSEEERNYFLTVICINTNPSPASEDTSWDGKFLAYSPIQLYCYRFCKARHAQHPNIANLSHGVCANGRPMQWATVNFRSSPNKDTESNFRKETFILCRLQGVGFHKSRTLWGKKLHILYSKIYITSLSNTYPCLPNAYLFVWQS